jgi:hypothetical protein
MILRYTESVQKVLGTKTKPEPWLHVGLAMLDKPTAVIFIWDTRQVLEETDVKESVKDELKNSAPAVDNGNDLVGLKNKDINDALFKVYIGACIGRYGGVYSVIIDKSRNNVEAKVDRYASSHDSMTAKGVYVDTYDIKSLDPKSYMHAIAYGLLPKTNRMVFYNENKNLIDKAIQAGFKFNSVAIAKSSAPKPLDALGDQWKSAGDPVRAKVKEFNEKNK